jgi:hypothetical protein
MFHADGKGTPESFPDHSSDPGAGWRSGGWRARLHPLTIGHLLLRPWPRYLLSWGLALGMAAVALYTAWIAWNEPSVPRDGNVAAAGAWSLAAHALCCPAMPPGPAPHLLAVSEWTFTLVEPGRGDGNWGHAAIDFGGQWLMGRMIVEGRGHHLYNRQDHKQVLQAAYPVASEKPYASKHDYEALLDWLMSSEDPERPNLGGPMYPPVHAMFYAPLGLLPPQPSYRLTQVLVLAAVVLCGWLVERLTDGRVWWPMATAGLILFPGFAGAINLGQNAVFTLVILLAGWWQLKEGHPWRGGLVWGLLAYKPVWALAFFLGPLLLRRWRFAAAMALSGVALALATLPLVGVQSWLDWLEVGRIGAFEYTRQRNWINLSRDLLSLPRRWMLDFQDGLATNPQERLPTVLGTVLWLTPVVVTILVVLWRRRRVKDVTGPGAALVLLGAYFACYHLMYYDLMLAALPVVLLFADPVSFLPLVRWRGSIPPLNATSLTTAPLEPDAGPPLLLLILRGGWMAAFTPRPHWFRNLLALALLVLLLASPALFRLWLAESPSPPWDTFCLMGLWLWCVWVVGAAQQEASGSELPAEESSPAAEPSGAELGQLAQLGPDIGGAH